MAATACMEAFIPQYLPAYVRTNSLHHGVRPFEAQTRCTHFLRTLQDRDRTEYHRLLSMLFDQGDPQQNNGTLTHDQAALIARCARRFDREGDTFTADLAELALNGCGLLLDDVRLRSVAESMQADREARRMAEMRGYFLRMSDDYDLPF